MDVNNFNDVQLFRNTNAEQLDQGYMDNYVHKSLRMRMGDHQVRYLLVTFKGETLVTDLVGNNVSFPNS